MFDFAQQILYILRTYSFFIKAVGKELPPDI